jgi:hypothetical protein
MKLKKEIFLDTKRKEVDKKQILLPEVGAIFTIKNSHYKVTYLNPGKKRFTSEILEED